MTEPENIDPDGRATSEPDDEALAGPEGRELIARLLADQFGEPTAERIAQTLRAFDEWDQSRHPGEGLRERKKRITRQRISDVATALFLARGFDSVTVAEIADQVGVSEKTVYNYFPSKESLVFDRTEEQIERLVAAVRDRPAGSSPVSALVATLKVVVRNFAQTLGEVPRDMLPAFGEMVDSTPSLRAAWGEHRQRTVAALSEVLAEEFGVDPRDPEPLIAARALVSLEELHHDSQLRHVADGLKGDELTAAIEADLERGARLLEGGMWLVQMMIGGRRTKDQVREAGLAVDQARRQVALALRDARRSWREQGVVNRDAILAAAREAQRAGRQARAAAHDAARDAQQASRQARVAAQDASRQARKAAQDAAREAQRDARSAKRRGR